MLISRLVENLVKSVIYCVGIYAIVKWVLSRYKISKQDAPIINQDSSL